MKIIENFFKKDMELHTSLLDKNICFFDIETTGLNRRTDSIYLIGILYFDDKVNKWNLLQLFAEELKDEFEIVLKAYEILSKYDLIVNYNGTSFDIPFINSKLEFYKTDFSIDINKSFDLYRIIRSNKNILQLENYKLKTIENYLGIFREDKYSGKDCIDFYFDYLTSKNPISKSNILLHNYEDLYYLLDIIEILNKIDSKKSFIVNIESSSYQFNIDNINIRKDFLFIDGSVNDADIGNTVYYGDNFNFEVKDNLKFNISLEINIAMLTHDKKCVYIRSTNYGLPTKKYWSGEYNIPIGLIILAIEKEYYIDNLKMVMSQLIKDTFHN